MEQLTDLIQFNGYGQFIWPAYGLSALVLIGVVFQSIRFQQRTDAELAALQGSDAEPAEEGGAHEAQA